MFSSGASFLYEGLHVTLDKRYGSRTQLTIGYALSRNTGFIDGGLPASTTTAPHMATFRITDATG